MWLLCRRGLHRDETKYFLVDPPATAFLRAVLRSVHQRLAIEQQYAELKTELGLGYFLGRFYPGWDRHVALVALAHAFLHAERLRHGPTCLSFPMLAR